MDNKMTKVITTSLVVIGAVTVAMSVLLFAVAACPEFIDYGG